MADKRISEMPPLSQSDVVASVDYLPIVDVSEPDASFRNKRILAQSITLGSLAQTSLSVGIGTSSPVAKLDVVGEIRTTQSFNAGNAKYLAFSTSAPSATNFSLYGDTTQTIINAPSGGIIRASVNSIPQFQISETASAVNFLQVAGAAAGKVPVLSSQGSDTNTGVVLQSKGTGAIDLAAGSSGINVSNGTTVTAVTIVNDGIYTTMPTGTIAAPTTTSGVQATFTFSMRLATTPTITSGGTGYTVGDVLTFSGGTTSNAATVTVSTVSSGVITAITVSSYGAYTALPSSPISVTGGTGSGATFTTSWSIRDSFPAPTITNAGSGYVEQPTITFSGSGGATAYASIGAFNSVRTLNPTLDFYTPNGGRAFQMYEGSTGGSSSGYWAAGSGTTSPYLVAKGATNTEGRITSSGTGAVAFWTNGGSQEQVRVTHTASTVNYVAMTGAATTARPAIYVGGSDTNIGLNVITKGSTGVFMYANGGSNALMTFAHSTSGVNYFQTSNAAAGSAPILQAVGSDTDIDITFTPKGAGVIRFGTHTGTTDTAISGYITIKDSGGTTRKLAVIT